MRPLIPAAALALLLTACGVTEPPPPPPPPPKSVIDAQLKAIDKAKAVQGVVDDQKAKTDEQLKDAGG